MANVGLGGSIWNTLRRNGTAAQIHANFDRKEPGQNVDSGDPDRRKLRILRPGAIILPNLDIDENPAKLRTRFRHNEVDALGDDKVNEGDDHKDITQFKLAEPKTVIGNAVNLTVLVHPDDAKRIRIWEVPKGKTSKDGVVVIGPGKGHEYKLLDQTGFIDALPDKDWELEYVVEALTLPGDSLKKAPLDKAPTPLGAKSLPAPAVSGASQEKPAVNLGDPAKSMYDTEKRYWELPGQPSGRAPGDAWLEIIHETDAGPIQKLREVGLFTIAPWIMTWNTLKCERIYVAYLAANTTFPDSVSDNHGMVWDLQQACQVAGLANAGAKAPDPDSTQTIPANTRTEIQNPNDVPLLCNREIKN